MDEVIRKYGYLSKVYKAKKLPTGEEILLPVLYDLTTMELRLAYEHFIEIEDYEYAQELAAEAILRGISL